MKDAAKVVLIVIVGILLLGVIFKLLKVAIIVALVVGGFVLLQNHFGRKRIK